MTKRKSSKRLGQTIDPVVLANGVAAFDFSTAEVVEIATAAAKRHPRVMRIRPDRHPPPDVGGPVPFYPGAFGVTAGTAPPSRRIAYAAGDYYLQDAGSLLALAVAGTTTDRLKDRTVCDLCASPGGKASAMIELIGNGLVVANEPIGSRLAPLAVNLARTGSDRYVITRRDPDDLATSMAGRFDLVLIDAPCSGQTMVGRGKQGKSSAGEAMIAVNVARQRRILAAAAAMIRPGGRLVYSTCTFAVAENEDQIRWLSAETDLVADPVAGLEPYASGLHPACYRTWPHRHGCDGSFAASMRLPGGEGPADPGDAMPTALDDAATEAFAAYYGNDRPIFLSQRDWIVEGWPRPLPDWIGPIAGGPEWMHRVGKTWRPSHAAALRPGHRSTIAVDNREAAAYLAGQSIACQVRGWSVVVHDDRPLGWIKGDGRGRQEPSVGARQGPRYVLGSPVISLCKTG